MLAPSLTPSPQSVPPPAGALPATAEPLPPFRLVPYLCIGLVVLADLMFYQAPRNDPWGWIVGGFAGAMLAGVVLANPRLLSGWTGRALFVLDAGLCLAMVEQPSMLALLLFTVGLASLIMAGEPMLFAGPLRWALTMLAGGMLALVRLSGDVAIIVRRSLGWIGLGNVAGIVTAWLLPVGFALVFLALFASANPLLDGWLKSIDWRHLWAQIPNPERLCVWLLAGGVCWTALRAPLMKLRLDGLFATAASVAAKPTDATGIIDRLFSTAAVLRSMVVFNLLFAAQNGLDLVYLWGGRALPVGQTYASYAHASAYPLIVTALIAAAFVLIAFRPGAATEEARMARPLMYLWIVQNIVLVASAVWRTWAYIGEYSLTHLRLAALIWMGLVAAGLLLVIVRFASDRSNSWLLNANILSLGAVLYASCFLNYGGMIADYNVRSCKPAAGCHGRLDVGYLYRIGQPALPALQRAAAASASLYARRDRRYGGSLIAVNEMIIDLQTQLQQSMQPAAWRSWTYQGFRTHQRAAQSN